MLHSSFYSMLLLALMFVFLALYIEKNNIVVNQQTNSIKLHEIDLKQPEQTFKKLEKVLMIDNLINGFANFEKIYYINLDSRLDRKQHISNEFERMYIPHEKIERISAIIDNDIKARGCSKSHLLAIEKFINSTYENCIVFEDDFLFSMTQSDTHNLLNKFWNLNIDWDVLLFSKNNIEYEVTNIYFLHRILRSSTTSGYAVNKKFAKILWNNFNEGIQNFTSYSKIEQYAIDGYWLRLQRNYNWFSFNPVLGTQIESFSDIESRIVNYNETKVIDDIRTPFEFIVISKENTKYKHENILSFTYTYDNTIKQEYIIDIVNNNIKLKNQNIISCINNMLNQNLLLCRHIMGVLIISDDTDVKNLYNLLCKFYKVPFTYFSHIYLPVYTLNLLENVPINRKDILNTLNNHNINVTQLQL